MKSDLNDSIKKILVFRNARKWKQFHNHKDMAISLSLKKGKREEGEV